MPYRPGQARPRNSKYASTVTSGTSTELALPTGCGLPLDENKLHISAHNFREDAVPYFD